MIQLTKLIPEIKISPRSKIVTNEQLYNFLKPNLKDFVKFLDHELRWNINIFNNHLDYDKEDYLVLSTIGDGGNRYATFISINNDLEDLAGEISEVNYKGTKMYIGV